MILAGMAFMALLGLIYALMTTAQRRSHDVAKPPPEPLSVPFVLRLGLGVYIIVLVYTVVRGWTRRSEAEPSPGRSTWRSFSIPGIALVGLILVVLVIQTSRGHKPKPEAPPAPAPVRAVAPPDLPGLGFLPEDASLVAGVHVAELVQGDKSGLVPLWLAASFPGLNDLERRTGIKLDAVDQAVLGFSVGKKGSQLTLVVQTSKPFDREAVARALRPRRVEQYAGRPLYVCRWGEQPEALVWYAARNSLVLVMRRGGTPPQAMTALPATPRLGKKKVPSRFRLLFEQRPLPSGTPVWVAGCPENRTMVRKWLALTPLNRNDRKVTGQVMTVFVKDGNQLLDLVETFEVGIRLGRAVTLTGIFRAADAPSAQKLAQLLGRRGKEASGLKVVHKPGQKWVVAQFKANGKDLARALTGPGNRKER
jgi:hypothetical protein